MIMTTALYKELTPKLPVTVPSQNGSLTYTGGVQSPGWTGFYDNLMEISGQTSGTNAGTYTVTFSLKDKKQYQWENGTVSDKQVDWGINKASPNLTVSDTNITLNSSNLSKTITVNRNGDGAITASSSDTTIATVSVNDTSLTISSVNNTKGTVTITVSVASSANHEEANTSISVISNFSSLKWNIATGSNGAHQIIYGKTFVGQNALKLIFSSDGKDWTKKSDYTISNICYGKNMYVSVYGTNYTPPQYYYSGNGSVWYEGDTDGTIPRQSTWESIAYGNNKFIAVAYDNSKAYYSTDGKVWGQFSNNLGVSNATRITYCNLFIVEGSEKTISYSTDGSSWSTGTKPVSGRIFALNNSFYIFGENCCYKNTNGNSWSLISESPYFTSISGAVYAKDRYFILSRFGNLYYSSDLINWENSNINFGTEQVLGLVYGNNTLIAYDFGRIQYATNLDEL